MQKFRNSNQFKAFMKKEAQRLGIGITGAYTTYMARVLLEKLSKYNDGNILVKGSSAETAYLGRLVRGITDVDLAVLGPIEANMELLQSFLNDETISDFRFKLSREPKVTPTGIYKTTLEADFDKTKQPLGVDFQDNYGRLIEKQVRMMPPIFEGDEPFPVIAPSFEEYLAEKLCIIAESNKTDVLNTRVKDFYDIYHLHGGKYDNATLTKYFRRMLELRGKIKIEDVDTDLLNEEFVRSHQDVWDRAKDKYDFINHNISLVGAVYYTRAVIREELQKNGMVMPDHVVSKEMVKEYKGAK